MNPLKAEVGTSIVSLLESAEDLLSRCRAVDVEQEDEDEEEFNDVKKKDTGRSNWILPRKLKCRFRDVLLKE